MKMWKVEKWFVNSTGQSQRVSRHFERLLDKIEVRAGQKYLDVGCGNGVAPLAVARRYDLAVTGVDVDPEQIALAQAKSDGVATVRFLTQDGQRLPFRSNEFDIVATNNVMHHIAAWPLVFGEMVRVLKTGGYLLFADFLMPGWVATIGQAVVKERAGFPTRATVDLLVERYGLIPLHVAAGLSRYEAIFQRGQTVD